MDTNETAEAVLGLLIADVTKAATELEVILDLPATSRPAALQGYRCRRLELLHAPALASLEQDPAEVASLRLVR
jgi:hypothetical protein